jgi:hypothetical protein
MRPARLADSAQRSLSSPTPASADHRQVSIDHAQYERRNGPARPRRALRVSEGTSF